jgi:hypothetical protein
VVIPAGSKFASQRDGNCGTNLSQNGFNQGQVTEQSRSAIAFDDLVNRAAEIDVDNVETAFLANSGGFRHDLRIRPK